MLRKHSQQTMEGEKNIPTVPSNDYIIKSKNRSFSPCLLWTENETSTDYINCYVHFRKHKNTIKFLSYNDDHDEDNLFWRKGWPM